MSPVENLARYLVNERKRVDEKWVNPGAPCPPYPSWDEASQAYRDNAILQAQSILDGDVT
jgi:hypothetical protein